MGQKVNPTAFRLGVNKKWNSLWVADKNSYSTMLHKDLSLRDHLNKRLKGLSVDRIIIKTSGNKTVDVVIYTSKPGILIGRRGERLEKLKKELEKISGSVIRIAVKDVKKPDLSARIIAEEISEQLEKRMSYKKALNFAATKVIEAGAIGVKVQVSGRLGGADMKRKEYVILGRVPLQTISADIDYAYIPSKTQTGIVGVKVWIFKGIKTKKDINNVRA